jgi:hypothetical protein
MVWIDHVPQRDPAQEQQQNRRQPQSPRQPLTRDAQQRHANQVHDQMFLHGRTIYYG